ncbi:uncharacterized protein LOC134750520 [Cydia strobilella]|uniref:uncharacterized protein LOC134750520 n=1 Tax=Cydia strobilella TaxID=1100964 RepID=UPI00300649E0
MWLMWHLLLWFTLAMSVESWITWIPWDVNEREHAPHYVDRIQPVGEKYGWEKRFQRVKVKPKRPADLTPDWKIEEIPPEPFAQTYYEEFERPYKLAPFTMSAAVWDASLNNFDHPQLLGCYCCTVYKRLTPLAGCAVLTTRHILTTATSTELVLKDLDEETKDLENILGAWYDIAWYHPNNSVYMTPARIHYHPNYIMPENVNASHPIPGVFDLAVWASTYPFYRYHNANGWRNTYVCNRAGSYWLQFGSPVLGSVKQPVAIIVGFQFILWYKRKPSPFYKYAVKTQKYTGKCPKTEWGWFFCVWGRWAGLGLESGAALHRATQGQSWLYDGLLGLNSFSMDLRAKELTHYFTPVENHAVLSWLYDAYMGRVDYRWLDDRFENTEWRAPLPKPGVKIEWKYNDITLWIPSGGFEPPIFYKK